LTVARVKGRAATGRPTCACATLKRVDIVIRGTERPQDADELRRALHAFNEERTGYHDGTALTCYLRDGNGHLIAGLDGFTWGGYGRIEYLWVEESHRGSGLGRRLVEAAAAEARLRDCATLVLDTHTFQAPGFYAALGFVEVGRTTGTPRGYDQVLMQLDL
jgi:ribosomal protein S18 acetylase RimI-like enzyme